MSKSENQGKEPQPRTSAAAKQGKETSREAVPNPPEPMPEPTPAPRECFLDGSEQQYELLIGVRHGVPRPRRMWPGSAGLATHYICDECWQRLGHRATE